MHAALDLNIKEVVGFYLFSLSLRSRCAVLCSACVRLWPKAAIAAIYPLRKAIDG